jgi:hypothetical protein
VGVPAPTLRLSDNLWGPIRNFEFESTMNSQSCKNSKKIKKADKSKEKSIKNANIFCRNKPNFPRFTPENDDFTKKQTQYKPNSNPIQSQYWSKNQGGKAKQTQFKPKIINSQF